MATIKIMIKKNPPTCVFHIFGVSLHFKRGRIQDYFDGILTANQGGDNYCTHIYRINLFIVNADYDISVYVKAGDTRHQKPDLNADDSGVRRMTSMIYCRNSSQAEG